MLSIPIEFPYTTPSNYTLSDSNKIGIDNGKAVLLLQQDDINFTEDFANDTGFTYNASYAEFIGGVVRQKNILPVNSICGATFTNGLDLSWGLDSFLSLAYNANGTPVLSSGKVDCIGSNGLYYSDSLIGALSGNFVAKFKYTPHYTTGPATNVNIFSISETSGSTNGIFIFNSPSGNNIRITANGLSASTFNTWTPIAETEYTFEIICINNQISIYIDNVQIGTSKTITPGQGTNAIQVWLGAHTAVYNQANGAFDDFILYSTAPQTPIYTIPEFKYLTSSVVLPEMQHIGDGTIKLFNSFSTVESGSPRYVLQIDQSGTFLYWNGVAWVVSNNTYSQANDASTFNANCVTLPVDGAEYGQFKIIFPDTNTQSSVDSLTANMNVDIGYPTDNPTIETNTSFRADGLISFTETSVKTGLDEIKHILKKDNNYYWNNAGTWEISNETYSQANTATEIETYKDTFLTEGDGKNVKVKSFLHSNDGSTKPDLDKTAIEYDFSGDPPTLRTITFYGNARDLVQAIVTKDEITNIKLKVRCNWIQGSKVITASRFYEETLSIAGYFEIPMIFEDGYLPTNLEIRLIDKVYKTNFIDQDYITFGDLTVLWQNKTEIDYLGG